MYAVEIPSILARSSDAGAKPGVACHSPAVVSSRLDEVHARLQSEKEASEDLLGLLDEMMAKMRPAIVEGGMVAVEERQSFVNGGHWALSEEVARFADDLRKVGAEIRSGRAVRSTKFVHRYYTDSKGASLTETRTLVAQRIHKIHTVPPVNWELQVVDGDAAVEAVGEGVATTSIGVPPVRPPPPPLLDNDAFMQHHQELVDDEMNEQDEILERLGHGVQRVRAHAVNIREEVQSQTTMFDSISTEVERVMEKLGSVNAKINVILENMSNCKKIMIIFLLFGILLTLIMIVGS